MKPGHFEARAFQDHTHAMVYTRPVLMDSGGEDLSEESTARGFLKDIIDPQFLIMDHQ